MKFSMEAAGDAEQHIATTLVHLLRSEPAVTWFVSGGSAIASQIRIMQVILRNDPDGKLQQKLMILPVDERFGPYNHSDSNSAQMRNAGFDPGRADWHDVLQRNLSLEETVEAYAQLVDHALKTSVLIATLGMGADAHTAGILPGSPAIDESAEPVLAYKWTDYTRMTTSFSVLRQLQVADVLAYGEAKQQALGRLQKRDEPISAVPSMVLYDVPTVTVYNSFLESEG